jgi:hypothetical protein
VAVSRVLTAGCNSRRRCRRRRGGPPLRGRVELLVVSSEQELQKKGRRVWCGDGCACRDADAGGRQVVEQGMCQRRRVINLIRRERCRLGSRRRATAQPLAFLVTWPPPRSPPPPSRRSFSALRAPSAALFLLRCWLPLSTRACARQAGALPRRTRSRWALRLAESSNSARSTTRRCLRVTGRASTRRRGTSCSLRACARGGSDGQHALTRTQYGHDSWAGWQRGRVREDRPRVRRRRREGGQVGRPGALAARRVLLGAFVLRSFAHPLMPGQSQAASPTAFFLYPKCVFFVICPQTLTGSA